MPVEIHIGDNRAILPTLPALHYQTCITSPPYYGLRNYDGNAAQIGIEETPEDYVAALVDVFREVRRVLRADGCLWLNLGDSYAREGGGRSPGGGRFGKSNRLIEAGAYPVRDSGARGGAKNKDLLGIPWMVAFALRADGWYLRGEQIWSKPNATPESVRDRPTRAHETLFLLTKKPHYFYDQDAVREPHADMRTAGRTSMHGQASLRPRGNLESTERWYNPAGRNLRSVWTIATATYGAGHFAVMPGRLVRPCILASTSARGACSVCGAPWNRMVTRTRLVDGKPAEKLRAASTTSKRAPSRAQGIGHGRISTSVEPNGWASGCRCKDAAIVPCRVLDPFGGTGTVGEEAALAGRDATMIEIVAKYEPLMRDRLGLFAPPR